MLFVNPGPAHPTDWAQTVRDPKTHVSQGTKEMPAASSRTVSEVAGVNWGALPELPVFQEKLEIWILFV